MHNPAGTGRPLQAEIKQRSPFFSISVIVFFSLLLRDEVSQLRIIFILSISSSIICKTSAFICE